MKPNLFSVSELCLNILIKGADKVQDYQALNESKQSPPTRNHSSRCNVYKCQGNELPNRIGLACDVKEVHFLRSYMWEAAGCIVPSMARYKVPSDLRAISRPTYLGTS